MVKKQDDIPKWVVDEIKNAKFGKPKELTRTGYILEIYDKDNKIDSQLYEPVEDGRSIITLDKKVVEYLKTEKEFDMNAIYQFELNKIKLIDDETANVE